MYLDLYLDFKYCDSYGNHNAFIDCMRQTYTTNCIFFKTNLQTRSVSFICKTNGAVYVLSAGALFIMPGCCLHEETNWYEYRDRNNVSVCLFQNNKIHKKWWEVRPTLRKIWVCFLENTYFFFQSCEKF